MCVWATLRLYTCSVDPASIKLTSSIRHRHHPLSLDNHKTLRPNLRRKSAKGYLHETSRFLMCGCKICSLAAVCHFGLSYCEACTRTELWSHDSNCIPVPLSQKTPNPEPKATAQPAQPQRGPRQASPINDIFVIKQVNSSCVVAIC